MPEFQLDIERTGSDETAPGPSEPYRDDGKRIRRKDILNLINFIHFQGGSIYAQFRHGAYSETLSVRARPNPCESENLECSWVQNEFSLERMRGYGFEDLLLSDGKDLYRIKAEADRIDERGATFKLPDFGHEKSDRRILRHVCGDVSARVLQNGVAVSGKLLDFCAISCSVELDAADLRALRWLNREAPVILVLEKERELIFSGECSVIREDDFPERRRLVVAPTFDNISRYRAREYRSERHKLTPSPNVRFEHPLTGKRMHLQATNLSASGFATEEFFHSAALFPGMVIPEISIEIGNGFLLRCRGQVLYRNMDTPQESTPIVRCGVAFLDIGLADQADLAALLQQTENDRLRVCNRVDMDELWHFFFESGFIYPSKYAALQDDREAFKRTYEKLYLDSPSIARHFIFQDRGSIFGHMSMIRNHARTWLIHHHAAARSGYGMAGIAVLNQVGRYINEFHRHDATRMDYVMCYYRKENRFPSRVFGGVVKDVADPKGSSVASFAYFRSAKRTERRSGSYQLMPANKADIAELRSFYERTSGGSALRALNLDPRMESEAGLDADYRDCGFRRERAIFALKLDGELLAVFLATFNETGLNLSGLTDCVHAFVLKSEYVLPDTFISAISDISEHYEKFDIPILVFPAAFMDSKNLPYEKRYELWVLNMEKSDSYFKSLNNTFGRGRHGHENSAGRS